MPVHAWRPAIVLLALLSAHVAIPSTLLALSASAEDDYRLADPVGDVTSALTPSPIPMPDSSGTLTGAKDLVGFRIHGEDEEEMWFEVQLQDVTAPGSVLHGNLLDYSIVEVGFTLSSTDTAYLLSWTLDLPIATSSLTGTIPANARFCVVTTENPCVAQRVVAFVNRDDSLLQARISKFALLGGDADPREPASSPGNAPNEMPAGTEIRELVVTSLPSDPHQWTDRMPDAGTAPPYPLEFPLYAPLLRVALDTPEKYDVFAQGPQGYIDYPNVPVPAGFTTATRLRISTDAAERQQVAVSFRFKSEGPAEQWGIRHVSSLTLPGGGARLVNLVFSPQSIPFGTSQVIQIVARDTSDGGLVGAHTFRLVSSPPSLSPETPTLHLHAATAEPPVDTFFEATCRLPICGPLVGWLNTEDVDPDATGDNGVIFNTYTQNTGGQTFELRSLANFAIDVELSRDVVLSKTTSATAAFRMQSTTPVTGELTMTVTASGASVAQASQQVSLTGAQTFQVEAPITYATDRIEAGSDIVLTVELAYDSGAVMAAFLADPPRIIPGESSLTLPIIEDPDPKDTTIPAGPALIGLSTPDPTDGFLNPGDTALFNITLVNEGIQEDILRLTSATSNATWTKRLEPASAYRLEPGESVVVGLYLVAPSTAEEGAFVRAFLNATSDADESARASMGFALTVTTGADVVDEAGTYQDDGEASAHLVAEDRGVPAPAFLVTACAAVGVAAWRRARRVR